MLQGTYLFRGRHRPITGGEGEGLDLARSCEAYKGEFTVPQEVAMIFKLTRLIYQLLVLQV